MITLRINKNDKTGKVTTTTFGRTTGTYKTIEAALDAQLPTLVAHSARWGEPVQVSVTFRNKSK